MNERYLIVADDFTGANDTGVQLRRRGFATEVLFSGKPVSADKSIVIDTESRAENPAAAYELVLKALSNIDFAGFRYVIKKVDSTMRGNIALEVKAVDEMFGSELMIFAPALPALNRTTVDGVQRLNGVGICHTELASDPKNPVVEDNLVTMLKRVYDEKIFLKRLPEVRSEMLSFQGGRIFACDAETDEDLQKILTAAAKTGKRVLYIGTAGIADALMELERPSLPAFGVAASVSSVTNRQMHYCEENGVTMIKIPMHKILAGEETLKHYKNKTIEAIKKGEDTILLASTSYDREELELSLEEGEKQGMGPMETGDKVRELIGSLAVEILKEVKVSGVFLTGGDTALGMLKNIGADGAEILSEIRVGIPMVRVKGGEFDGLKLVTKAGAFGADDAAAYAMRKIKEV